MDASPTHQLDEMIDRFTPEIAGLTREALARLRAVLPPAYEMVYDNTYALVVGFCPSERPSEAIFSIVVSPRSVSVCFLQAFRMPQFLCPLLRGNGTVARNIKLKTAGDFDLPEVRALIDEAMDYAKVQFGELECSQLTIRSIAEKRRPRRP